VDKNLAERKFAANQIESDLKQEILDFKEWVTNLGVVPVLAALREKGLSIQADTFASINRKIPNLTEREQKVISKHTKSIINQMIKEPIIQAKEKAGKENSEELIAIIIDILGIDNQIKDDIVYRIKRSKNMIHLNKTNRPYYLKEH